MATFISTLSDFIVLTFLCQYGASQRLILNIGPRNITRTEGEINVYIPCPFPGSASPIWIINGVHHAAFNLPENMISVSYGLLVTVVTLDMDGKTFQCIVPTGVNFKFYNSSIGILTVEKQRSSLNGGITSFISASISGFTIDHQRTVFEPDFKTVSWRDAENCGINPASYQLNTVECDGTNISQRTWDDNVIQSTSVEIPTSFTVYNKKDAYFKLSALNGDTRLLCQLLIPDFSIKENVITDECKVPFSGFCLNISSPTGTYIVLPSSKTNVNDCPCAIVFREDNSYQLDACSCGIDSIFLESFIAYNWRLESQNLYHVCFLNLTREMNNTRIHFYELYRSCEDNLGHLHIHPYRLYFKSLQIQIVLPDPPEVMINSSTGQIYFSSPHREGIDLDYYQVIIADVTEQTIFNNILPPNVNNIYIGNMLRNQICLPYTIRVEAHNAHGARGSEETETRQGHNGDVCSCITDEVIADVDLINDDASEVGGISIQLNCSHNYSQPNVYVKITILQHGEIIDNSTHFCEEELNVLFDNLQCDTSYDLMVSWISASEGDISDSVCPLNFVQNRMIECPKKEPSSGLLLPLIYIIIIVFVIITVTLILIILILIAIIVHKSRKSRRSLYCSTQYKFDLPT